MRVIDLGDGIRSLSLMLEERPRATIFRGWRRFPLSASVCTTCGYTELYVREPASVREARVRSLAASGPIPSDAGGGGALASSRIFLALALGLVLFVIVGVLLFYALLMR
jgi:hypothetical protein